MSDERAGLIDRFLGAAGWGGVRPQPLANDASFRAYFRLRDGRRRAVLMDAPPPREDVRPFIDIARHLTGLGYSAPHVLAADEAAGLVLLEDLGDDTFSRLLADGADEGALYRLAIDLLVDLHQRPLAEAAPAGLARYDGARLIDEAELFVTWYLPAIGLAPAAASFRALWPALLDQALAVPETLVLRDYHVDNLMRLSGRRGVAACGLLDFQDAVIGPVSYDLMSLLEDARRDLAPGLAAAMIARYGAGMPGIAPASLARSCAILAAQRHCKVIGIFTRLCRRDGKPAYLDHIPRVWRLLDRALDDPALAPLKGWIDTNVPPALRRRPPCRPAA